MRVEFNYASSEKNRGLSCECLAIYMEGTSILKAIEVAGPETVIRAVWAEIVKGKSASKNESNMTIGLKINDQNISVSNQSRFIKKQINKNQIIVIEKGFGFTRREFFFGGDYNTPSEYFLDAMRLNLTNIPFSPTWRNRLWTEALERELLFPLTHFGEGRHAWGIKNDESKWMELIKVICLKDGK